MANTTLLITILTIQILLVGIAWFYYFNLDELLNTSTIPLVESTNKYFRGAIKELITGL